MRSGSRSGLIDSPFPVPRGDCAGSSPAGILASSNAGICSITPKTMTTFLTTEQREFLLEEYREVLEEFDQIEEYGHLIDDFRKWDNVSFWIEMTDQMPIYKEPGMLAKVMAKRSLNDGVPS